MSLRLRLTLLLLASTGFATISGLVAYVALERADDALSEIELRRKNEGHARDLQTRLLETVPLLVAFRDGDHEAVPTALTKELQTLVHALLVNARDDEERELASALESTTTGFLSAAERVRYLERRASDERVLRMLRPWILETLMPDLREQVDRLVELHGRRVSDARIEATEQGVFAARLLVGTFALQAALLVAVFILARRWIVRPVDALVADARRIGTGEYEPRDVVVHDELDSVAGELDRLARTLDAAQRELVERERLSAMGEMTYAVAHNIRNPLASIRALAQSSRGDDDAKQTDESLSDIMRTVDRIDRWLKDLFIAFRPVPIETTPVGPRELLEGVRDALRDFAAQQSVELRVETCEDLPKVAADDRRLDQAIVSLVTNAVEASSPGSPVVLSARREGTDRIRFTVADEGAGLDALAQSRMFAPDYSTKKSGTGVGLHMTQRIVLSHQGRIEVDSAPNEGCRISLVLPVARPRTSTPNPTRPPEGIEPA